MKKKLSILVVISLVLTIFAGCNGLNRKKVVYLVPGKLDQKEEFKLANQAIQKAESDLGVQPKVVEMGDDQSAWGNILKENSKQKGSIIISSGDEMAKLMNQQGVNNKANRYINFDTVEKVTISNGYFLHFNTNELGFLSGVTAALATKSDMENINKEKRIGFIGYDDNTEINNYLVGYIKGAEFITSDTTMDISYIGNGVDSDKTQEVAEAILDDRVDVIYSVANEANKDIIDISTEKQKYIITENEPLILQDNILAYCRKNIDTLLFDLIKTTINKELEYGQYKEIGLKEKAVDFIINKNSNFTDDLIQKVELVKQKIVDDEISVKSIYGMDEDTLNRLRNLLH